MSSKEDKIKIKVAIARLKKKNAFYKDYCKSNKIKIKGRVKEAIDSINLLCKLITKLAARKDFYQKLPEGFEGPCGYVQSAVSAKTDLLVCGENVGASKKSKAEKLSVKMLSENEYFELLRE